MNTPIKKICVLFLFLLLAQFGFAGNVGATEIEDATVDQLVTVLISKIESGQVNPTSLGKLADVVQKARSTTTTVVTKKSTTTVTYAKPPAAVKSPDVDFPKAIGDILDKSPLLTNVPRTKDFIDVSMDSDGTTMVSVIVPRSLVPTAVGAGNYFNESAQRVDYTKYPALAHKGKLKAYLALFAKLNSEGKFTAARNVLKHNNWKLLQKADLRVPIIVTHKHNIASTICWAASSPTG